MTRAKNIWDAVWGQIELTDEEWQLVSTPTFQRLRRIHQLAMTMLVFPGANHTRFEHSLGTKHVADRLGQRLVDLYERGESAPFTRADAHIARLAALLHDVGHGPFSHVVDTIFDEQPGGRGHEWIGAMAIQHVPELRDVLEAGGAGTASAIADLLVSRGRRTISRDIVSGPTDADKIDYLLRDSHYTGVRGGHFDHEYFIDQVVGIKALSESWLGFRWNGIWSIEGMILARYHMFRTVYGHRNRVVTDLMLERALRSGVGAFLPADLLTLPEEAAFLPWFDQYRTYDDWRVFSLGVEADNPAGGLFRRLRDHQLLKVLVFLEGEELRALLGPEYARQLGARRDFKVAHLHEPLAIELGIPPEDVIVHMLDPRHVLQRDPLRLDEDINFIDANGDVQAFAERSEVFSAIPPDRWRRQLVVYGPVGRRDDSILAARAQVTTLDLLRRELEGGA